MLTKLYRKYVSQATRDKIYDAFLGRILLFFRNYKELSKALLIWLFLPFCGETDNRFHARYNFRAPGILKKLRPQVILYHLFNRDVLLTFEIMNQVWKRKLDTMEDIIK